MKRISTLLIALAMTPTLAMAQTNIEKAIDQVKRSSFNETAAKKETEVDDDGVNAIFEQHVYEMPSHSSQFKKLIEAFDNDQRNAYSVFKRLKGTSGNAQSIGYGRDTQKTVSFGNYKDRNYYLLLFNDTKDKTRRKCYEVTWYDSKSSKKKDNMLTVDITYIYSKNPKNNKTRASRVRAITITSNDTIIANDTVIAATSVGGRNTMVTIRPDGTIIKYNRDTGSTIVYKPQDSNKDNDIKINNSADFMVRFNNLRTQYIKVIEFAGKDQTFFADGISKPVNEMMQLCRNYHRMLNADEQTTCVNIIEQMKTKSRDKAVQEMLDLAKKYVRGN